MSAAEELQFWVRRHLGELVGVAPETIVLDRKLSDYGLDSVDAVLMAGELEDHFGIEIDPASFIHFTTFEVMIVNLTGVIEAKGPATSL
jgi:phthiocerol/phenolphthiocerol synthesis type-I polyketide synthase B